MGEELNYNVKAALVDDAILALRIGGARYKTVLDEMLFREGQPVLKTLYGFFLRQGFKHAGTLKEVAEKNGMLFDEVILQRTLDRT